VDPIVVTWRELLLVGAVVALVYVAEAALFYVRLRQATRSARSRGDPAIQARLDVLEQDVATLRHQLLEVQLTASRPMAVAAPTPSAVLVPPERAAPEPPSAGYSKAIELARQGLDAGYLSANCGISRGEAELIIALHRFDAT